MEKKNRMFMVLALSVVPALGFSGSVRTGVIMSIMTVITFVLSRAVAYPLTQKSSKSGAFLISLLVNAFCVSAMMMLLEAFFYEVYSGMGIYFALNAISTLALVSTAEEDLSFGESIKDTLTYGDMFCLLVILSSLIREVFGSGSFYEIELGFMKNHLIPLLAKPQGGFFACGVVFALLSATYKKEEVKK